MVRAIYSTEEIESSLQQNSVYTKLLEHRTNEVECLIDKTLNQALTYISFE